MEDDDKNLQKLKYATEWQVEIGKILQSFDPVLRPLEDMAKHGITMATVLLGISTSIVGGFASGSLSISCNYFVILGAWFGFVVATVAGSIQLYRISNFRETIRNFCHVLLGGFVSRSTEDDGRNESPSEKCIDCGVLGTMHRRHASRDLGCSKSNWEVTGDA